MTIYLLLLASSILTGSGVTPAATIAGPPRVDRRLVALRVVRDLDRDGAPDLCLRAFTEGSAEIAVISAGDGKLLWRAHGPEGVVDWTGAPMPASIAALGDLDRDGLGEIAALWRDNASDGEVLATVLAFHSGADGRVLRTPVLPTGGRLTGSETMTAAGDLDGDLLPDLFVLSPARELATGRLSAIASASGELLWSVPTGCRGDTGDGGDAPIVPVRDVDGDGTTDVALVVEHAVDLVSGRDGKRIRSIALDELAAPTRAMEAEDAPSVPDETEGTEASIPSTVIVTDQTPPRDRLRESWRPTGALLVIGDRDADGIVDLGVLLREPFGPASSLAIVSTGSARVLGHIGLSAWSLELADAQLRLAGLVDADHVNDFVLADPGWNLADADHPGGVDAGRVSLVSGAGGTEIRSIEGGRTLAQLGRFSALAGDVDRDGTVDVWFSARDIANRPHDVIGLASGASGAVRYWIDLGRIPSKIEASSDLQARARGAPERADPRRSMPIRGAGAPLPPHRGWESGEDDGT